jgi:C4-dicarboxylate-specific signal transduction histidine kinase
MYLLPRLINSSYLTQLWSPEAIEMASFKHAVSTPVTVLLSVLDNSKQIPLNSGNTKRVRHALDTLQQLCGLFNAKTLNNCRLSTLLQEVADMLTDEDQRVCIESWTSGGELDLKSVQVCRLKEAITCLIKNGLESYIDSRQPAVFVAYTQTTDHALIHIKDFGSGMNIWQRLFMSVPFITFKQRGSGIGCAFSRRVIEYELKGKLIVHSCVGIGTSIECRIPLNR